MRRRKNGRPHVDGDRAILVDGDPADAGAGLDAYRPGEAITIVEEAPQAADAVPAARRLGTIRIEHLHTGISHVGRKRQEKAIGADTEMTVAHRRRELRPRLIGSTVVASV